MGERAVQDFLTRVAGCGTSDISRRWDLIPQYPDVTYPEQILLREIELFLEQRPDGVKLVSQGIFVRADNSMAPYIFYLLASGAYEHGDIHLVRKHVRAGDAALVLGGGIGVIAAAIADKTHRPVTVVDANPALASKVACTAKLNGVELDFIHGAIAPDLGKSGQAEFWISEEFWASSLSIKTYKAQQSIQVPLLDFEQIAAEFDTLFIDIESAEMALFSQCQVPPSITQLFVEIHRPNLGEMSTAQTMNAIFHQGFSLVDMHGMTSVWQR
ncbi:hypothetical protein ACFFU8_09005 [Chromobacterium piscinae]|uniref:hypothetical protein n=1 Tax=Chromobacterium piscinae TaxID=686831 RepID=UPI001E3F0F44|nr:hypothetical protein [Chromobacterium piscinae]MCD5327958.1 hypothetical protein [Chromobacterium piscinae]